jgi:hypothetical protein
MATAVVVFAGYHRVRYLIASEGIGAESISIPTIGGATPDTLTDSRGSGVIKELSKVVADGYGLFAAGAQTQAKARALWLSDTSGANPGSQATTPLARSVITPRTGAGRFLIDANVSAGNPVISISIQGDGAGVSTAYLDIESPRTIGA